MSEDTADTPRLCVDCRHYRMRFCALGATRSPVDGTVDMPMCLLMRMAGSACGPVGALHQPRDDAGKEPF